MSLSVDELRRLALSLPYASEKPHFDRAGFRVDVPKGKMFCTLLEAQATANVFLSVDEQLMLVEAEPGIFSRVPNKWGEKGATTLALGNCDEATAKSALVMSWRHAAPVRLHDALDQ